MHMEGVGFESAVFDRPVFHGSNVSCDHRLFVGLKHLLLLSVDRDVELNGSVGAAEFFREEKLALGGRSLIAEVREF